VHLKFEGGNPMALIVPVAIICWLVSVVCWIMVLVKIFQSGSVGLGILGIICGLFAFIYGWMKADEYGIRNVMLTWSIAIAVDVVVQGAFVAMNGGFHH